MHLVLAVLRILGAFGLGLILGLSAVRILGMTSTEPGPLLVLVILYAAIGGGVIVVTAPRFGAFLLLGWAAPWLLIGFVVVDDLSVLVFPAITTALYVLALGLAAYRAGRRREGG